jgi:hypothetical protein
VRASWSRPLSGEFIELVLMTLTSEGEDAARTRLLAKLDEAPVAVRRDYLYLLTIIPGEPVLAWLDARIESPVVDVWGRTAALLGIGWARIAAWMARGRPHSLAALDALAAYAQPHPGRSPLDRAVQPVLANAPPLEELRATLHALRTVDDSPRVAKSADDIIARAAEILRGGASPGISARTFFERAVAKDRAERLLWAESHGPLPVPEHQLKAGPAMRTLWQQRWVAAVRACERRGGSGLVRVGSVLGAEELAAIEREIGVALPPSVAEVFTHIAADIEVSWQLPKSCTPPATLEGVTWGTCAWDAHRLTERERDLRAFVEKDCSDPGDEYWRVWRSKFPLFDTPNGDLVAVDVSRSDRAPVVYLSHDGGEGHGRVLGYSFADFIDRWTLLGCVGPEDWLMTPFLHPDRPYLDATGETARSWRAWFGLDALAVL